MRPFTKLTSTAMPLRTENVDTDQIIPARYLTAVTQAGMGDGLFSWWRYNRDGSPNPDFVLNQPQFKGADVLVAGRNFGSGSSREHAPWALMDYGFRCVIAPSFADIFYNNCFQNGLLPVVLREDVVKKIISEAQKDPGYSLTVDLEAQRVWDEDEEVSVSFEVEPFRRHLLLNGLDDIGLTLEHEDEIAAFEGKRSTYGGVVTAGRK